MKAPRVAWIAACLALALATVLRVLGFDDRSTAYLVGGALGSVVAAVLIALLLRFLYVRLLRRGRPIWSPWTPATTNRQPRSDSPTGPSRKFAQPSCRNARSSSLTKAGARSTAARTTAVVRSGSRPDPRKTPASLRQREPWFP